MHLEDIMLSELSQAQGTMISLICGIKGKAKPKQDKKDKKILFVQIWEYSCWCQGLKSLGEGPDVHFELVKEHKMSVT